MTVAQSPIDLTQPHWELQLTVLLLRRGLAQVGERHRRIVRTPPSAAIPLDSSRSAEQILRRLRELRDRIRQIAKFFPAELQTAWGPPGQPGDVVAIRRACTHLVDHLATFVSWEGTVAQVAPAPDCAPLFARLRGCTRYYLTQCEGMIRAIETAIRSGGGNYAYTLVFDTPPALIGMERDIARLGRDLRPFWRRHPLLTAFGLGWLGGSGFD